MGGMLCCFGYGRTCCAGEMAEAGCRDTTLNLGKYVQTGVLAENTFGLVVRARNPEKSPPADVAISLLHRSNFTDHFFSTRVKTKIWLHASHNHPFFVALQEVFLTPTHLAIVTEFAQGTDLGGYVLQHQPVCRLSEAKARWIFQQLIIGREYCRRRGLNDRDLKLENLLLDRDGTDGTRPLLKICDFGYLTRTPCTLAEVQGAGVPYHMPPEAILGSCIFPNETVADIWSCGIILYTMLFGQYPFDALERRDNVRKLVIAQFALPSDVPVSAECADLLMRMLVADPNARLPMDGILRHPWFLKDLPDDALRMNDYYLQLPYPKEWVMEGIDAILKEAEKLDEGSKDGHQGRTCCAQRIMKAAAHWRPPQTYWRSRRVRPCD